MPIPEPTPAREPEKPMKAGRRRRHRWPWVVLIVLIALVGSTIGAVALVKAQVTTTPVPDVHDKQFNDARTSLAKAGFKVGRVDQFVDGKDEGIVVAQRPVALTKLREGKTVVLTVSKGATPVDVPDLTGKTVDEATSALAAVQLQANVADREYSESVDAGVVIKWSPTSGTHHGDTVDLTVSSGPRPRTIPDLTAMTLDQATAAINALGLTPSQDSRFDDTVPKDKIIGTRPPVGTQVDRGSSVVIVTSKGQPSVPSLTGKSAADAKTLLEANDLKLGNVYGPSGGLVVLSNPSAGSKEKRGTSVDIYVI
jgi:serine/threonine-protein kinase